MLATTLASRAARAASDSYGIKRRPQQRTHIRRQLPCTLGAVEPPLHTLLCGASAVSSSSCVCVRWMERRGNHRGRGRGQWCGREGGRDNATHSQPLRSAHYTHRRCVGYFCTSSEFLKHSEPHRTYTKHTSTEIARCLGCLCYSVEPS